MPKLPDIFPPGHGNEDLPDIFPGDTSSDLPDLYPEQEKSVWTKVVESVTQPVARVAGKNAMRQFGQKKTELQEKYTMPVFERVSSRIIGKQSPYLGNKMQQLSESPVYGTGENPSHVNVIKPEGTGKLEAAKSANASKIDATKKRLDSLDAQILDLQAKINSATGPQLGTSGPSFGAGDPLEKYKLKLEKMISDRERLQRFSEDEIKNLSESYSKLEQKIQTEGAAEHLKEKFGKPVMAVASAPFKLLGEPLRAAQDVAKIVSSKSTGVVQPSDREASKRVMEGAFNPTGTAIMRSLEEETPTPGSFIPLAETAITGKEPSVFSKMGAIGADLAVGKLLQSKPSIGSTKKGSAISGLFKKLPPSVKEWIGPWGAGTSEGIVPAVREILGSARATKEAGLRVAKVAEKMGPEGVKQTAITHWKHDLPKMESLEDVATQYDAFSKRLLAEGIEPPPVESILAQKAPKKWGVVEKFTSQLASDDIKAGVPLEKVNDYMKRVPSERAEYAGDIMDRRLQEARAKASTPGFLKHRAGFTDWKNVELNPAKLIDIRSQESARARMQVEMEKMISNTFQLVEGGPIAKRGYVVYNSKHLEGKPSFYMPKQDAAFIERITNPKNMVDFEKYSRGFTGWWTRSALLSRPGYAVRNIIGGNLINGWARGVKMEDYFDAAVSQKRIGVELGTNPAFSGALTELTKGNTGKYIESATWGKTKAVDAIRYWMDHGGENQSQISSVYRLGEDPTFLQSLNPLGSKNLVQQAVGSVATITENNFRLATYIRALKDGATPKDAMGDVAKYCFNASEVPRFVEQAGRVQIFANWFYKAAGLWFNVLRTDPVRVSRLVHLYEQILDSDKKEYWKTLPYLSEMMQDYPIPMAGIGGEIRYARGRGLVPMTTMIDVITAHPEYVAADIADSFQPIIKGLVSIAATNMRFQPRTIEADRDRYIDAPGFIDSVLSFIEHDSSLEPARRLLVDELGIFQKDAATMKYKIDKTVDKMVSDQVPFYSLMSRYGKPNKEFIDSFINWAFGISGTKLDERTINQAAMRNISEIQRRRKEITGQSGDLNLLFDMFGKRLENLFKIKNK